MKRSILVYVFVCSACFAFSNDFYRVKSNQINARSWASTSSEIVRTYNYGEVLSIGEYHSDGRNKWGAVADTHPTQWVAISNLRKMSQEEINQYFSSKQKATATQAPKKVQATHESAYYILLFIKVLAAIYSIICFIYFYKEAKKREKESTHAIYGLCCFALLFWIFFPCKWQWLWVGCLWAGLFYPFAYAKLLEKNDWISGLFMFGALLLCGLSSWFFLRKWDLITEYVGKLNGFEVTGMVIANIFVTGALGAVCIIERCPICRYFCKSHLVDTQYEGSCYYDVVRTETNEVWDHRDVEEDPLNNKIRVTDYYQEERKRTTSTYRRDHFLSTYYCPHCCGKYKHRYSVDKLIDRVTRRG